MKKRKNRYEKEIKKNPAITRRELASAIGKSERTVKTRTVEMQEVSSIGIWRDDNQSYSTENIILSHKRGVYKYGY